MPAPQETPYLEGRTRPKRRSAAVHAAATVVLLGTLWALARSNYLLFHGTVEGFSILAASAVFWLAWVSRRVATNGYLTILGAGMLPVAVMLVLHMFAHTGVGVIVDPTGNVAAQLWLIASYLLAATMLVAALFARRQGPIGPFIATSGALGALLAGSVLVWRIFPAAYVPGQGLTVFYVVSEYVAVAVLAVAALLLYRVRDTMDTMVARVTLTATGCFALTGIFLTVDAGGLSTPNLLGHVLQLAGFILLTLGIVRTTIEQPMNTVFAELKASEARLTQLNRVLTMVGDCHRAVAVAHDENALLERICRIAVDVGGYRLAWVGLAVRDDIRSIRPVAGWGSGLDYVSSIHQTWNDEDIGAGPMGVAIRTNRPASVRDMRSDPSFAPWRESAAQYGFRSSLALPLHEGVERTEGGARVIGAIAFYADRTDAFDEQETGLLEELVTSVCTGLESLRLRAEREEALRALRAQGARLEALVAERTTDLERTVAQLRDASEAKDVFLRNMSHELRTPLNSIIGFSDLMMRGVTGTVSEEQRHQLQMVNTSGRHLLGLISQILDLDRLDTAAVTIDAAPIDVSGLVEETIGPIRVLATQAGLECSVALDQTPGPLVSDEAKLRQILLNLLGNAVKFTPSGRIGLRVIDGDHDTVRFVVEDSGRGIPEDEIPRVMEEFHQVRSADDMKPEGTGLGLTISRRLAEMLGGRLDIESRVDHGSTFTLTIPRHYTPQGPLGVAPGTSAGGDEED